MKSFADFISESKKPDYAALKKKKMSAKEYEKWLKKNFKLMNPKMDDIQVAKWLKDKKNVNQAYDDYISSYGQPNRDSEGYPEGHPLYMKRKY